MTSKVYFINYYALTGPVVLNLFFFFFQPMEPPLPPPPLIPILIKWTSLAIYCLQNFMERKGQVRLRNKKLAITDPYIWREKWIIKINNCDVEFYSDLKRSTSRSSSSVEGCYVECVLLMAVWYLTLHKINSGQASYFGRMINKQIMWRLIQG